MSAVIVRGDTKCVPENVDKKLYNATRFARFTMVTEADTVRSLLCSRLSSPIVRSNKLREAIRAGLLSSFCALGARSESNDEVSCAAGHTPPGIPRCGVAAMPPHAK